MSDSPCKSGWEKRNLTSLAQYLNGRAFREDEWGEEGLPIIRIEQINDPSTISDRYDGPVLRQNLIDDGDLVFSWSATLKAVIWKDGPAALNQHLFKVVPNAGVDRTFLKQLLDMNMERLAASSQGSTMKHVPRSALERYRACVPASKDEQASIAEILSTVDEAIEQTEKLIAKHQQIKAGLMHDLFTRGLTPDGRLRPPHTECPSLYKDSPLDPIPKEWDMCRLGEVVARITDGSHQAVAVESDGTIPFLYVSCVRENKISFDGAAMISSGTYDRISAGRKPKAGVILYTAVGSYGYAAMLHSDSPLAFQRHIAYIDASSGGAFAPFLAWLLNCPVLRRHADRVAEGNAQKTVTLRELAKYPIPVPESGEQERIAQAIDHAADAIQKIVKERAKLLEVKRGLMHDLLSGEVEVPIPEAEDHA